MQRLPAGRALALALAVSGFVVAPIRSADPPASWRVDALPNPAGADSGEAQLSVQARAGEDRPYRQWAFDVQTEAGGGTPTFTFKQEGEKITGHMSSQTFGEQDVTGTLKGQDLTFSFKSDALGAEAEVVYKGKVESNESIKGTLEIPGLGSGTFTAARAK